jgi:hypothetical protein
MGILMNPRSRQLVNTIMAVREAAVLLERGCPRLAPYIREAATQKYTPLRKRIAWNRMIKGFVEWIRPPAVRSQAPRQGFINLKLQIPMPPCETRAELQGRFAVMPSAFPGLHIRVEADRMFVGWLSWAWYPCSMHASVMTRFPKDQSEDPFIAGLLVDEILSDRLVLLVMVTLDNGYDGYSAGAHWLLVERVDREAIVGLVLDADAKGSGVAEAVLLSWSGQFDETLVEPRYDQVRASHGMLGRKRTPKVHLTREDLGL